MLAKLAKYKVGLAVLATLTLSLALAPAALAGTVEDAFGMEYGAATGLGQQDVRTTIATIINVALSLLGIVALIIVLYGGFKWMTAGGNDEQVAEARKIIISGVVGLAVVLSSYAVANFVLNQLAIATGFTP
ncbi:hypothetical protein COV24_04760 [candidate division WWE3 bacterium CG10_big_fil_rev_8_21_14_0_10_32_10]|uniref:Uncharacterized protein n=1 Tax=candidate division WWE3 bacterium CG10_big_fil_rev_8_21_14_0_10_32_10 TaxID=1975090 RepID=A0A2H0R955_UNCKA|nr:MAG: hypothetical protein COV24_04760 [candidate division WWE3 bacterium CG10_big_fil_rev_8_21_14_0_10_32_10]